MMNVVARARREAEQFSAEQIEFGERVWEDIKRCWNIDATDEEQCARASRAESECKRDWLIEAIEDDVVCDVEEFVKLLRVIREMDMSSMAYC